VCRLDYALFSEDFGKFDADVIINSITHTLTEGRFRDEFFTVYNDDAVNLVNFKVPYFYIQNYRGEYYYETSEKKDIFYPLDYFIPQHKAANKLKNKIIHFADARAIMHIYTVSKNH
jgi:NAD+--asparagine ADP-ribosyltransferase